MSEFYGSFLANDTKHEKYKNRIEVISSIAEECTESLIKVYPNIDGLVFISYQNIHVSIGRYFNDVDHYKKRHNIKLTHTSKIVAHTVKWVSIYPVLFCSASDDKWDLLSEEERTTLMNVNYIFISQLIQHFIDPVNPNISEATYDGIDKNLMYFLKTGNYNERMASLWFEQIIKG